MSSLRSAWTCGGSISAISFLPSARLELVRAPVAGRECGLRPTGTPDPFPAMRGWRPQTMRAFASGGSRFAIRIGFFGRRADRNPRSSVEQRPLMTSSSASCWERHFTSSMPSSSSVAPRVCRDRSVVTQHRSRLAHELQSKAWAPTGKCHSSNRISGYRSTL